MRIFTILLSLVASLFISNVAFASTFVSGTISSDTTWTFTDSPYVVTSDLSIPGSTTLTIEPGVVVKFANSYTTLDVYGTLDALGTVSAPIVFTAYKDDTAGGDTNGDGSASYPGAYNFPPSGDWRAMSFNAGSVSHIAHASIRYGGQIFFNGFGYQRNPMMRNDGGILIMESSEMRPGPHASEAFNQTDGDTTVTDSHFTFGRVFVVSGGTLSVHGSTFARSSDALINNGASVIDATGNWWGDASGPSHTNNPNGAGSRVMGDVSFVPFLTTDPTAATVTLSDATTPTIGSAITPLTFKVVYTNSFNQAPVSVRLVATGDNPDAPCQPVFIGPMLSALFVKTAYASEGDGCAMEVDISSTATLHDGDYSNGEQYILTQQFPVGNYAYHFEADDVRNPGVDDVALVVSGGPVPCTENCNSSILFLPGIEASRLYRPDYSGGTDQLWEPNIENDVTDLYLDEQGKSIRDDIYTKDVLDEKNVLPFGQGNVYKSFIDTMDTMKSDGLIGDWKAAPYDWRVCLEDILSSGNEISGGRIYYSGSLSATTSPFIIQELRRLAATSRTGKVTIIAHSNGGLVAKALTDKLGAEASSLIDQIIFVAVPQVGTPQAIGALLHGYDQGLPFDSLPLILTSEVARQFASTAPMTYNLLPSSAYFTYVDDSVVTFDNSVFLAPWRTKYGDIHSGERLHSFIADQSRTLLPVSDNLIFPISGKEALLNDAEALHNTKLDNWTPPAGVPLSEIAGWGEMTMKSLEYYEGRKTFCSTPGDIHTCTDVPALEYGIKEVMDGDGTVVVPSALWTPAVMKYWVNLDRYNNKLPWSLGHFDRKHADILEVPQLRDLLKNIIVGRSEELDFISIATPTNSNTDTRLRFTLHSPLYINLYDNLGNHTGISTTTGFLEENIPGSRYKTYGELKYIEAPASTTLRLVLNGYAIGSFTLDVEKKLGEVTTSSTTFAAIPSLTSTVATITVPQGGNIEDALPLTVDVDGDGASDLALSPSVGAIVLPDFMPPQTTALPTGALGANNWYTSNVVVTLTATDVGSGVQSTFYSLNGGAAWSIYTAPFTISGEGSTTLVYYSVDSADNREATKTLVINIDKTAPKASIFVDPTTKDLKVEGIDNAGSATVAKSGDTYTITDVSGHTTKLFFQKTFTGNRLTYAKLTKVQYENGTIVTLPSSYFVYLWQLVSPQALLSQTIVVNDTYVIEAAYDKVKNKTTVLLKKKGAVMQTQTFTGLHIVKFTVDKGVVGYEI